MYWTTYSESFSNANKKSQFRISNKWHFALSREKKREKLWWSAFGSLLEIRNRASPNVDKTDEKRPTDDYGSNCAYLFSESRKKIIVLVKPINEAMLETCSLLVHDPTVARSKAFQHRWWPYRTCLSYPARTRTRMRIILQRRSTSASVRLGLVWSRCIASRKTVSDTHLMASGPGLSHSDLIHTRALLNFGGKYMNIIYV